MQGTISKWYLRSNLAASSVAGEMWSTNQYDIEQRFTMRIIPIWRITPIFSFLKGKKYQISQITSIKKNVKYTS